jgi:DmsE family decaheme c-type cytochrome
VSHRGRLLPLAASVLAGSAAIVASGQLAANQNQNPPTTTETQAAATAKCADCHEDQVKSFAGNPHAAYSHREKKPDIEEFCASCHGDGAKHIEAGGDKSLIQGFHGVEGAKLCATCHDEMPQHGPPATGLHATSSAVNCLSCHSIHNAVKKSENLLAKQPGALCESCHQTQSGSFRNKPYAHRLDRGGMTCLDCHSAHARKDEPVKLTRQGELPCLSCHSEKRGPFVFDHVSGSAGNCLSCHQPHGSNNPNMLLWARVDQLCLSCHSQTGGPPTLGSQPPSFHDLRLPRYRNCTTCHVAVHGSNLSPQLLK